jgi:hypothetical protein
MRRKEVEKEKREEALNALHLPYAGEDLLALTFYVPSSAVPYENLVTYLGLTKDFPPRGFAFRKKEDGNPNPGFSFRVEKRQKTYLATCFLKRKDFLNDPKRREENLSMGKDLRSILKSSWSETDADFKKFQMKAALEQEKEKEDLSSVLDSYIGSNLLFKGEFAYGPYGDLTKIASLNRKLLRQTKDVLLNSPRRLIYIGNADAEAVLSAEKALKPGRDVFPLELEDYPLGKNRTLKKEYPESLDSTFYILKNGHSERHFAFVFLSLSFFSAFEKKEKDAFGIALRTDPVLGFYRFSYRGDTDAFQNALKKAGEDLTYEEFGALKKDALDRIDPEKMTCEEAFELFFPPILNGLRGEPEVYKELIGGIGLDEFRAFLNGFVPVLSFSLGDQEA